MLTFTGMSYQPSRRILQTFHKCTWETIWEETVAAGMCQCLGNLRDNVLSDTTNFTDTVVKCTEYMYACVCVYVYYSTHARTYTHTRTP